ncbi:hypothetical protein CCR94_17185 [Rhodoblastus sphagnicola]|uniref:MobA/VirD2-like nuclease domain-containing protein n=1 Tax=Rhodoblastus sphagnicola TaxID=333368 RepID=A0A2S6N232_9HYPH|nr:relaxase/mobilization nuclease domain-containing protein [Rhodoblastus sphagnicola]MBB4199716.1 hypothetical protein [Rhodoblastus sphagnicola]PPQ28656.1 hypothetical protein CCR94_17185 [Rhodoblastus sphagnicola]
MIGKIIIGANFAGLFAYLAAAQRHLPPESFLTYNVASAITAVAEMIAEARKSGRVKRPVGHLIFSWRADEAPTRETVAEAIDRVFELLGLQDHKALGVIHSTFPTVTPHFEVHVMISRVGPDGKVAGALDSWSFAKIERAVATVARDMGFLLVPGRFNSLDSAEFGPAIARIDPTAPAPLSQGIRGLIAQTNAKPIRDDLYADPTFRDEIIRARMAADWPAFVAAFTGRGYTLHPGNSTKGRAPGHHCGIVIVDQRDPRRRAALSSINQTSDEKWSGPGLTQGRGRIDGQSVPAMGQPPEGVLSPLPASPARATTPAAESSKPDVVAPASVMSSPVQHQAEADFAAFQQHQRSTRARNEGYRHSRSSKIGDARARFEVEFKRRLGVASVRRRLIRTVLGRRSAIGGLLNAIGDLALDQDLARLRAERVASVEAAWSLYRARHEHTLTWPEFRKAREARRVKEREKAEIAAGSSNSASSSAAVDIQVSPEKTPVAAGLVSDVLSLAFSKPSTIAAPITPIKEEESPSTEKNHLSQTENRDLEHEHDQPEHDPRYGNVRRSQKSSAQLGECAHGSQQGRDSGHQGAATYADAPIGRGSAGRHDQDHLRNPTGAHGVDGWGQTHRGAAATDNSRLGDREILDRLRGAAWLWRVRRNNVAVTVSPDVYAFKVDPAPVNSPQMRAAASAAPLTSARAIHVEVPQPSHAKKRIEVETVGVAKVLPSSMSAPVAADAKIAAIARLRVAALRRAAQMDAKLNSLRFSERPPALPPVTSAPIRARSSESLPTLTATTSAPGRTFLRAETDRHAPHPTHVKKRIEVETVGVAKVLPSSMSAPVAADVKIAALRCAAQMDAKSNNLRTSESPPALPPVTSAPIRARSSESLPTLTATASAPGRTFLRAETDRHATPLRPLTAIAVQPEPPLAAQPAPKKLLFPYTLDANKQTLAAAYLILHPKREEKYAMPRFKQVCEALGMETLVPLVAWMHQASVSEKSAFVGLADPTGKLQQSLAGVVSMIRPILGVGAKMTGRDGPERE